MADGTDGRHLRKVRARPIRGPLQGRNRPFEKHRQGQDASRSPALPPLRRTAYGALRLPRAILQPTVAAKAGTRPFIEKQRYLDADAGRAAATPSSSRWGRWLIGVVIGALIAIIKYCGEGSTLDEAPVLRSATSIPPSSGASRWWCVLLIFYFLILRSSDGIAGGHRDLRHQLRRLHGGAHPGRHQRRGPRADGGRAGASACPSFQATVARWCCPQAHEATSSPPSATR